VFTPLLWFGWSTAIFFSVYVLIRFWRNPTFAVTPFHLLLVGVVNFLGLAAIDVADRQYTLYHAVSEDEVYTYVSNALFFLGFMVLCYHASGSFMERRSASLKLKSQPTATLTYTVVVFGVIFSSLPFIIPSTIFVSQLLANAAIPMLLFSFVVCAVHWFRNPFNPLNLALVIVMLSLATLASATTFGRSGQLNLLFTVFIVLYFSKLRHWGKFTILTLGLVCGLLALAAVSGLNAARFDVLRFDSFFSFLQSGYAKLSNAVQYASISSGIELLGGDAVDAGLATVYMRDGLGRGETLQMLKWVVLNPIPRELFVFAEKPEGLGFMLPSSLGIGGAGFSLGPSIVGHAIYDGGIWVAVLYGALTGFGVRFADEVVRRNPTNPFVLGAFGVASGSLMMYIRGDSGLYLINIVMTVVICYAMIRVTRTVLLIFGYQPDMEETATEEFQDFGQEIAEAQDEYTYVEAR
jgi:hypothetical protein